ncbi:hypothetical protein RF55_11780 [Lasius niger]|uniref:Uncharacterized protein n=1 Tax=Lasius niger TaxID=67767 RepID=A0A0J7N7R5_LASNI|nr:hypothetical protein RF55_11780 [Lasius niger]
MIGTDRSPNLRIALLRALVLTGLTPLTPGNRISRGSWAHLRGLRLADPQFDVPSAVDAVLGADVYGMLLDNGVRHGRPGDPTAHSTIFSWVLMSAVGQPGNTSLSRIAAHHATVQPDLHLELQRFWELESVPSD